jgi:hypothetical protein
LAGLNRLAGDGRLVGILAGSDGLSGVLAGLNRLAGDGRLVGVLAGNGVLTGSLGEQSQAGDGDPDKNQQAGKDS